MPAGNVGAHMPGNKMVQTFRVSGPRPGADIQAVVWVWMGQGKAGTTAKAQIVAAAFHPLTHGLASVLAEGRSLEPCVAARNQQQAYARAALLRAAIGADAPRLA